MTKGWECPRCGRIHSPSVLGCNGCNNQESVEAMGMNFVKYKKPETPCLWDLIPETTPGSGMKIAGLVCSCPKCSPTC